MTAPYLSAAEVERLAKLTEECGEISQMVGKTLVHGFENTRVEIGKYLYHQEGL